MRFSTAFAFISCTLAGMKYVDADAWINEFHYDNSGGDQGEFIEVAVTAGTNLSGWTVYFYDGSSGKSYATSALSGVAPPSSVSVVSMNKAGIQNGGSDGFALVDNSNVVVQFISYEGTVTASNGPATGMSSTNVGVQESSSTPIGYSLQLAGSGCSYGDFSWQNPAYNTKGSVNNGQTFTCQSTAAPTASPTSSPTNSPTLAPTVNAPGPNSDALWINEFHYDNSGTDTQEFVEIACSTGTDMTSVALFLYNGNGGAVYNSFSSITPSTCPRGVNGIGFISVATTGLQNGPDGIALYDGSSVVDFISYGNSFTATNGVASGMQSANVGVSEGSGTPMGFSLQKGGTGCSTGDFSWQSPQFNTIASVNAGQTINCAGSPTAPTTAPPAPSPPTVAPPTASPLDSNMPTVTSGHGTMLTSSGNYWILPSGIADIFIDVQSSSDLDFELFDGSTSIVGAGGLLSSSTPSYTTYGGLRIDYSGSSGEQRSGTEGWEYIHIFGTLSSDLTLQLSGSGSGDIRYWWGYYASVRTGGVSKSALNQLISTGPTLTALSYTPGCWDALKRTDQDWLNTNSVKGIYSRKSIPKTDQDSGCNCNDFWNREHVCPKSICGLSTSSPGPGTDIHSLRAEDKSVNTERSNKDFFEGGTAVPDCNQCFETSDTFEPPDVTKGDTARMIFYMSTRYINNIDIIAGDGSTTGSNSIGDQATLELWNDIDPVDAEEIHRNNMIFKIQGNRNPFIDDPAWVDLISW